MITFKVLNPNNVKFLVSFTIAIFISTLAIAQVEICDNGLDDDFDGFIDCYDGSCAGSALCSGGFIFPANNCSAPPPQFPQFTMTLDFASPNETTNHLARMVIGDLDRDGMPEIVSMNKYTKKLFILNGNDGTIKFERTVTWEPQWEVAIGNIDDDACGEIFFFGYQNLPGNANDGMYFFAYDCQLNLIWTSSKLPNDPINYGLADFDGDGKIELYAKDEIYDAHTGVRIVRTTAANYTRQNGGPVAADMVGDSRLELVIGLSIYQVNLGARTVDAGSLTLLNSRPEYFIRYQYNATSIADFNLDGNLDIIASGSENSHGSTTTIFYWDVTNNILRTYRDLTSDYGANGWGSGTGRVNIADLDGDGQLNVSYVSGKYLYALKEDLTMLWRIIINEETSGYTGCTLFDFNGDGKSEIVYRDEQFLYIIDGTDGSVYNQQNCISRTNREYPIVADVDADGSTELCVTCGFNDQDSKTNFNTLSYSRYSHVRVFKSAAEPWVPARRVWNQHGYFVVNVNDDLSIPKQLQKHHLVFSNGNCTQGPNRPLNKFLNQSPFLNTDGCPTYAAPDVAFASAITIIPPTCPSLDFLVSFKITNLGDVRITGDLPISFYTTNPLLPGSTKLNTITVTLADLKPNDIVDVNNATVTGIGADSLYVVLNDAGTTIPTPISLPNTNFFECDYDNILGAKIDPVPVNLSAVEVKANEKCASPDNGAARAFILVGGVENTADYDFYWSNGAVAKPPASADFVGPIYSGLADGDYTVYAIHKTANCSSDTLMVTVTAITAIFPNITITPTPQTQCNPPNGQLEALVDGGNAGYTFEWFDTKSLGITTAIASGLIGGTNYTVLVSRNGCSKSETIFLNTNVFFPDVTAVSTPVINCQTPNSGTVTAKASIGGIDQPDADYNFIWYFYDNLTSTRGSQLPVANGTGPTRTGLAAGFYEVVAENIASQCASTSFIIEVSDQTVTPVVTILELAPQTSCDPANSNGRFQAIVTLNGVQQNPADFTFEWFVGQNTLPANLHTDVSGVNGSIAEKVKGGGQAYTVRATSTASQCFGITDQVISETLQLPVATLIPTPNGICDPLLMSGGSPAFTGSVSLSVTFAGNPVADLSDYTIEWFNGSQITDPQRAENGSVISALDGGFYTVLVTNNLVSCQSTPETAQVQNITVLPVITTNAIPSTNCAPGLANGQAVVTDVDGVSPPVAPYVFQWHTGSDTSLPITGETAATLSNRQGGVGAFFTVLVTDQSNGCQNTETVEIPDNRVLPIVSLVQTPNDICDASLTNPAVTFNGTVTGSITNQVGAIGDYSFTWRNGQLITDPVNGSSITQNLTNLNGGYYTTTVLHTLTGCESAPVTIEVQNLITLPVITSNAIPSTNCLPGLANGQAVVTDVDGVSPPVVPYVFQWHTGSDTSLPIAGETAATLSNRQGGVGAFFTVLVTDQSNGCQNTETVEIPDNRVLPIVSLVQTPNDICDASLTNPAVTFNGTVTGSITNQVGAIGDYSFTWRNGQLITDPVNGSSITQNLNNLNAGYYTTTVFHTTTGCVSTPVTIEVQNLITLPVITTSVTPSTNCVPGLENGEVTVTDVDGLGIGAPYIFQWHTGNDTSSPIGGETSAVLDQRQGGVGIFFTVLVTDRSNGCQNTEIVELPDNRTLPILTLSATDNENCSAPFNGSASVQTITYQGLPEALTGYTFNWTNGATSSTISNLATGAYSVTATRTNVGCTSDPVQIDVNDDLFIPVINVAITNQTSCDLSALNGALNASINESSIGGSANETAGYTYQWVNNGNPLNPAGPVIGSTTSVNNLEGNLFYTISVERTATRCVNTQSVFLPNTINLPRLEIVATDIVDCNTNGFVTARVFIDKNNDGDNTDAGDELTPAEINASYTFEWYRGASTSGTLLSETGRVLNQLSAGVPLPAGSYTAVATNTVSNCVTSDFTDVINSPGPLFNIDFVINNKPASCADTDGVVTAFVDSGGGVPAPFNQFTFTWFQGNPVNGLDIPTPGFYTDPPIQFIQPELAVDPLNLSGNVFPGSPSNQPETSATTGPTLYGRPSGTYSVVVERADGCKEFKSVFLPFLQEPVIILARIKPDECAGDVGEIEVELNVPVPGTEGQYLLQLYASANPNLGSDVPFRQIASASQLGNLFTGLPSGIYTTVAKENPAFIPSGCFSSPVLIQMIESLPPKVDLLGSISNTTCVTAPVVGDGSLQIRVETDENDPFNASYPLPPPPTILQKGAAPFVTYSIDVKDASNNSIPGYPTASTFVDGDLNTANGLRGETYTITVTSSKGCVTTKTFDIPDAPVVASLSSDVIVLPALACDPALETNASIEVRSLSITGAVEICGNGIDDDGDGLTDIADSDCNDNLSHYQFDWFTDATFATNILSANGNNTIAKGGEILSNVGAPLPAAPVTAGSYWVRATKVVAGTTGGVGCLSSPLKVDIQDLSVNPTATLTPAVNTACDTNFEGSIVSLVTNPGSIPSASYTYTWTSPVVSPIVNGVSNGDGLGGDDRFTNLSDGVYALSFRNNNSGCIGNVQTTITKTVTPIIITSATPVDQLICNPDGSVTVGANDISVGGVIDSNHANFDFTWSRNAVATVVSGPTQGNDVLNIVDLPTIGADSYFVKVRKRPGLNPGSGCESAPFRVEIQDKSVDPTVVLTSLPDTSCDLNPEGSLNVEVTSAGSLNTLVYNYSWTSTGTAIANSTGNGDGAGADDNFGSLSDGTYTISIVNTSSGCSGTSQTVINKLAIPVVITAATPVDQLICNPDGSVTVGANDISVGGVIDSNHANFDFTWSRNAVATVVSGPTQGNDVLNIVDLPTIGADSYFVKVRKRPGLNPGSGCESAPFRVEILDKSVVPDLTFTSVVPNSSCNTTNPNGIIEVTASERSGPAGTYTFAWQVDNGPLPPVTVIGGISPVSQLTDAGAGFYSVETTNAITGCKFTQVRQLNTNTSLSLPNIVDIDVINPTNCLPQGSARVVSVSIGGTTTFTNPPDDLDTDFDYQWFKGSITTGLLAGEQNSTLLNQLPDKYFVTVRSLITDCISAPVEAVIDSVDIVYPVVTIQQLTPQVICTVNVGSGSLRALADGQNDTNPNYTFDWYTGLTSSGASFANTSSITDLIAGDYSIEVHNTVTDCRSTAIFILPENKLDFTPVLALSSDPLSECDTVDGSVYARAITFPVSLNPAENYPFTYDYRADLYLGNPPADINNPEFPDMGNDPNNPLLLENFAQENLTNGEYTVRLTDQNTGCITIGTVTIEDIRAFPNPLVTTIAPVTNCDPADPNGVGRVLVNGQFIGFQFDWYEGNAVAGTPVYTGSEFGDLKVTPVTYTIEATNLVTGCKGTVQTSIANGALPIPAPQIVLISDVTSCVLNNGELSASVGGNTKDFVFDWYDGTAEVPPPDFTGEFYDSLATGTYSVTATSKITGCKSPLVSKDVNENKVLPDFGFDIVNATCDEANGFANIFFINEIGISKIQWFSGNQLIGEGPILSDISPGVYRAEITSVLGCSASKEMELVADIRPRNGISRNGDSQNDYFHIDCIEEFVNNNVKIYNRAGTLVYEADGYDNSSVLFNGVSNKGVSIMGLNVPDGTYYYVVDKRDGSKPLAGYLEIVK